MHLPPQLSRCQVFLQHLYNGLITCKASVAVQNSRASRICPGLFFSNSAFLSISIWFESLTWPLLIPKADQGDKKSDVKVIATIGLNLKIDHNLVLSVGPYMNQCSGTKVTLRPRKPSFKVSMTR